MNPGNIANRILTGDVQGIEGDTLAVLDSGVPPHEIIDQYLTPTMREVGRRYERGEVFIPEMLLSARAMQASMSVLKPFMVNGEVGTVGRGVVIGTVEGDLHDIGKTLVGVLLQSVGFEVNDLGVNVEPDEFVRAVRDYDPAIVGLSALLTTTMPAMEKTISALKEAGLRDRVVVLVGGAPVTAGFAKSIGADGFAEDAAGAARRAEELLGLR